MGGPRACSEMRFAKHLLSKPGASALWRVLERLERVVQLQHTC